VRALFALLGSAGLIGLIYVAFLLAIVSQKIGNMTNMKPYYRWLYVAAAFLSLATLIRLLRTSVFLAPQEAPILLNSGAFYFVFYYMPLCVGMTIALLVTIKYWGWLLHSGQQ
jgi:hypothetical protein